MPGVGDYLNEWDRRNAPAGGRRESWDERRQAEDRFHRWVMVSVVILPGLAVSAALLVAAAVACVWAWRYVFGG